MKIYNLYIFERNGSCIFYKEWKREKPTGLSREEECKLMYGMLLSLRSFTNKLSPNDNKQKFKFFQTSGYKLNYLELPTGVKFVMNTERNAAGIHDLLRTIYSQIYVEYVIKNPLQETGKEISSQLFASSLDALLSSKNF